MLLDEAAGAQHAIDFLHPRRKPQPPNRFRRFGLVAGLAATNVLAIAFLVWNELAQLDSEIEELTAELKALDEPVKRARVRMADVARIEEFVQGDYGWLDEIQRLSQQLRSGDQVVLTQMLFSVRSPSGGQLILDGNAKTLADLEQVQAALRESHRVVLSKGGQEDPRQPVYRWQFKETVELPPRIVAISPAATTDSDKEKPLSVPPVSAKQTMPPESAPTRNP